MIFFLKKIDRDIVLIYNINFLGRIKLMLNRILLFIITNLLIIITLNIVLSALGIKPYLNEYGINFQSLAIFSFVWGLGGAFISLMLSKKIAIWFMGVKIIKKKEETPKLRWLKSEIYTFSKKAKLKYMPDLGIYKSKEVNAFATGPSRNNSLVAFSSGLLESMDERAIKGVIAHEIAHIASDDMVTMTLLQGVMNSFVIFFSRILAYFASMFFSKDDEGSNPSFMMQFIFTILFDIILGILASIVVLWFSRFREYKADRKGAIYAGKDNMIYALSSLKQYVGQVETKKNNAMIANLKISGKRSWMSMFSSHPELDQRIAALKNQKIAA